ncbi:unnamed protein product [Alopecurus aequalis]
MMEEDPLIALVHVWNNAAFDDSSSSSASAWHAHATPARTRPDKENRRPERDDVDAEIAHIEDEILRLSSRLHHLRTSRGLDTQRDPVPAAAKAQPRPRASLAPLDAVCAATNPNLLLSDKQQPPTLAAAQRIKPTTKQPVPATRGRGRLSLGPLDIAAANPTTKIAAARQQQQQQQGAAPASRIPKPIKEPPAQRRRGVSLGPMEIQQGVSGKPAAAAAGAARVKPFSNKLNAIREEGQSSRQSALPAKLWPSSNARQPVDSKQGVPAASRAKARSSSMSPRSRRQSIARATNTRGGIAAFGANKVFDELTPKAAATNPISNASTCRRPSGSSKVRVIPSRYSLMPGASLGAGTQERRRKDSLPGSVPPAVGAGQREDDELFPETLDKVAELLPRIRTMPPPDETPRDSGCAKRAADLVGKRSFFTAAAGDGTTISSYQDRILEAEAPEEEEAAAAEDALSNEEQ